MHKNGSTNNSELTKERTGCKVVNSQGLEMTCVKYINSTKVIVEFENPYYKTENCWCNFIKGKIRNPNIPSIYGVGIVGDKYPTNNSIKRIKEYQCWADLLFRVYGNKRNDSTSLRYKECTVCDEWLYYPNFYEWLHSQENFDKWHNGERWCLDKDILVKGNKIYSPETCCLVPVNVNTLFVKKDKNRGALPIGVTYNHKRYMANCSNPLIGNSRVYLGTYDEPIDAHYAYKFYKEDLIKEIAQIEFNKGNITKECYEAMMNYVVEIDD
jgi:hypothetical protein